MNATSPLLNYTRAFLRGRGLLPAEAPLVIDEASLTAEMIGLLRRRDALFAFTRTPETGDHASYHARLLHHENRQGRVFVRYVPIVEARFEHRDGLLALDRAAPLEDSPFGDEERTHVVLMHELLFHVVRHAQKRGYKALRLPADAPIPSAQIAYLNFHKLHGWPPPRNGQVLVPLLPAPPGGNA